MWKSWLVVILSATASSAEEPLPWWRTATFYQVYPRSFKDSNGDGIGDLRGIIQKAEHFMDIGVDALWFNPINNSPMADFGYDISNFADIEPIFGTMQDFDELLAKLKKLGIKLVLDFVPNHTSDEHEWFQMSADPTHPLHQDYRDFYVWRDAKGTTEDGQPIPPNNWKCMFGGSVWTWSKERNQFYFHHFLAKQPDLNYRNTKVVENMTEVLNFWLDKGVDGFRVDAPAALIEDEAYTDELPVPGTTGDTWFTQTKIYSLNQPETFELLKFWANHLYQRTIQDRRHIAFFLEMYGEPSMVAKYFGTGHQNLQTPFNPFLIKPGTIFATATDIKQAIDLWFSIMPTDGAANWLVGNHDVKRLPNSYGREMVDTMNLLTGVLPGVKCVYYGEEIGMENLLVSWERTQDTYAKQQGPEHYQEWSRDFQRTPMQWDDSPSAGFSTNLTTWLPVNPNYWWLNVAAQRAAPVSHLKVFQAMAKVRKNPVLQRGDLQVYDPDNTTLIVIRSYNGSYFALVANLGDVVVTYTPRSLLSGLGLDMDMSVIVGSINSGYLPGNNLQKGLTDVTLKPKAAILLRSSSPLAKSSTMLLMFTVLVALSVKITC